MNQVHKESLSNVENALPTREGLDIEIFGMEGVPEDIVQQHQQRIIQNFYQAQADRYAATGNPPPGQNGGQGPAKKIKVETSDELKKRLAEHKMRVAAQKAAGVTGNAAPPPRDGQSPSQAAPPQGTYPQQQYGQPGYPAPGAGAGVPPSHSPSQQWPPSYPPNGPPPPGGFGLPARPPSNAPPGAGLPQRPGYGGNYYGGQNAGNASTLDDLVSGAARQGDDIDQIIRMAEAGIKPGPTQAVEAAASAAATTEKKSKKEKDKSMRMIYGDLEVSPEERLDTVARYAIGAQS